MRGPKTLPRVADAIKSVKLLVCDVDGVLTDGRIVYDSSGRLVEVEKKSKRVGKRYKISFRDFEKKGKILYPKRIEITSRKGNLKISWRNVELNI